MGHDRKLKFSNNLCSLYQLVWALALGSHQLPRGPPAQIFLGWHVFCSPGRCLLISAVTLTFGLKVKP